MHESVSEFFFLSNTLCWFMYHFFFKLAQKLSVENLSTAKGGIKYICFTKSCNNFLRIWCLKFAWNFIRNPSFFHLFFTFLQNGTKICLHWIISLFFNTFFFYYFQSGVKNRPRTKWTMKKLRPFSTKFLHILSHFEWILIQLQGTGNNLISSYIHLRSEVKMLSNDIRTRYHNEQHAGMTRGTSASEVSVLN